MWLVTCDKQGMVHIFSICQVPSSNGLGVMMFWSFGLKELVKGGVSQFSKVWPWVQFALKLVGKCLKINCWLLKIPENFIISFLGLKFFSIWVSPTTEFYSISDSATIKFYFVSVYPTTKSYSISVFPTTAQWIYHPSHAWATKAVVGDTKME